MRGRVADALGLSVERAAFAIHELANAEMAAAIHVVTVQRGIDPRRFAIVATGGAACMHVCRTAARFDIGEIIVPPLTGVASAVGLVATDLLAERSQTRVADLVSAQPAEVMAMFDELTDAATNDLGAETGVDVERTVAMRYTGQAHELDVRLDTWPLDRDAFDRLAEAFYTAYQQAFGIEVRAPVQLVSLRARVRATVARPDTRPPMQSGSVRNDHERHAWFPESDGFVTVPVSQRAELPVGEQLFGPWIVEDGGSTVVVAPSWLARVHETGALWLTRTSEAEAER